MIFPWCVPRVTCGYHFRPLHGTESFTDAWFTPRTLRSKKTKGWSMMIALCSWNSMIKLFASPTSFTHIYPHSGIGIGHLMTPTVTFLPQKPHELQHRRCCLVNRWNVDILLCLLKAYYTKKSKGTRERLKSPTPHTPCHVCYIDHLISYHITISHEPCWKPPPA